MDIEVIFIILLIFLITPSILVFLACIIEEALWNMRDARKIMKKRNICNEHE